MHTKRGAIFLRPLGRGNIVTNFGVHVILYARFRHPYIFKKPVKNNGANSRKKCVKVLTHVVLADPWTLQASRLHCNWDRPSHFH